MQIFFIRNKIKKRKLINVDGECFVREKKSINRENLRIILTVFFMWAYSNAVYYICKS